MYFLTCHGVTVGFHRGFTHQSFRPNRATKIALAMPGSMAIQGPVVRWVADHRKHHKFSDRDGDPHSPWKYGDTVGALWKGCGTPTWGGSSTRSRPRRASTRRT